MNYSLLLLMVMLLVGGAFHRQLAPYRYGFPFLSGCLALFILTVPALPNWYAICAFVLFAVGTARLWYLHWRDRTTRRGP